MKSFIVTLLATASIAAGEGEWNYSYQGTDWDGLCATGIEQSPIDFYSWKKEDFKVDLKSGYAAKYDPVFDMDFNPHTITAYDP